MDDLSAKESRKPLALARNVIADPWPLPETKASEDEEIDEEALHASLQIMKNSSQPVVTSGPLFLEVTASAPSVFVPVVSFAGTESVLEPTAQSLKGKDLISSSGKRKLDDYDEKGGDELPFSSPSRRFSLDDESNNRVAAWQRQDRGLASSPSPSPLLDVGGNRGPQRAFEAGA
nr:hypothetical protein Iba_chr03bCG2570 [Ipomoea batatas]